MTVGVGTLSGLALRIRMEQIRRRGADAVITWLVYRTGYELRGAEDGVDHIANILSVRDKPTVNCRWSGFVPRTR